MTFPAGAVETRRAEASRGALGLISRAKKAGYLREDFSDRDLTILLLANSGVARAGGNTASNASWPRRCAPMPPRTRPSHRCRTLRQPRSSITP
jgi:hypothetical protein